MFANEKFVDLQKLLLKVLRKIFHDITNISRNSFKKVFLSCKKQIILLRKQEQQDVSFIDRAFMCLRIWAADKNRFQKAKTRS